MKTKLAARGLLLSWLGFSLLLLAPGCSNEDTTRPREFFHDLHGTVRDSTTLDPLVGASVSLGRTEGGYFEEVAVTESEGTYTFENVGGEPSGFLRFSKAGYFSRVLDITRGSVAEGPARSRVDAHLPTSTGLAPGRFAAGSAAQR